MVVTGEEDGSHGELHAEKSGGTEGGEEVVRVSACSDIVVLKDTMFDAPFVVDAEEQDSTHLE